MAKREKRIEVLNLVKQFGDYTAVNNVSFKVYENEFFSLLGPSGCGKTTTLRCISGLEEPTAGEISISGQVMTSAEENLMVPPERREIGMVFQNYAVWPHMTVERNISYPLRLAKKSKREIAAKLDYLLDLLELQGLEKRFPSELSGGQQQRVALGRALSTDPKVMLLDEPLSNLDAKLREQMRFELKDLQQKTGISILYVTHDQVEAMAMSDRVAVMKKGDIVQEGSPHEIYENPKDQFVADFIGTMNFLPCTVTAKTDQGVNVRLGNGAEFGLDSGAERGDYILAVRPEDIVLGSEEGTDCEVDVRIFLGNLIEYRVRLGEDYLRVQTDASLRLEPGDQSRLMIKHGLIFPK
ncbi:MAG: ABC transporter ATP-binding protein [Firmicutes bacterium]|nr:ABC transporter ATP-binding protein [Bacillota bacterium]